MKNRKKKKRGIALAFGLLLVVVIVFSVAGIRYGIMMPLSPVRTVVNELAGYAGEFMARPVRTIHHVWSNYIALIDVREENRILRAQLLDTKAENIGYREIILENRRLKHLLEIKERFSGDTVVADVVGYDLASWADSVMVNKGKEDGVRKDSIVLYGMYAVGHVTALFLDYSRVMLISSNDSAVAAIIQRNRARGILYGGENGMCRLDFLEKDVRVEVGDTILTSGTDGIFPKGLILGTVVSVQNVREHGLFKAVSVKPMVRLSRLENVIIPVRDSERQ